MNRFESINNQTVFQWNGVLSQSVSNELRVSVTQTNDRRVLPSNDAGDPIAFPEVRIQVGSGLNVILGPERSSQANALDQTIIALTDDLTWFTGDHTITLGTHNEFSRFNNLFIQDYYGSIQYASVDAYRDSLANYYRVSYANDSVTGGNPQPRAAWNMLQVGGYLQDEWQVTDRLRLTGGIRVDMPIFLSTPYENPVFAQAFAGRSTSATPGGILLISPRFGFNWDPTGEKKIQIRGGSGIFTGRVAAVWLSNQYSNTGMDLFRPNWAQTIPRMPSTTLSGSPSAGTSPSEHLVREMRSIPEVPSTPRRLTLPITTSRCHRYGARHSARTFVLSGGLL
jgi:outer membrane receptor protein involved in Fe transport